MAEAEVAALKEALYNQYIIMKKLYAELEEEREASATAASEALSMILRLQREKAAEKMEACQYKRMAEEKMHHAEECLAFFEEITQQDEMEITALRYQLEIYKQKLARHGVSTPYVAQVRISEKQSSTESNVLMGQESLHGFVRRNISLPSLLQLDQLHSKTDVNNVESSVLSRYRPIWRTVNENYDGTGIPDIFDESAIEDHAHDWKQTEEVNKKLKELTQAKNAKEVDPGSNIATSGFPRPLLVGSMSSEQEAGSCSWYSAVGGGTSYDSTTRGRQRKLDDEAVSCLPSQLRGHENSPEFSGHGRSCSVVHDQLEISESRKDHNPNKSYKEALKEPMHEANNISGMPKQMQQESVDYLFKGDDWLNKLFMNGQYRGKMSPPRKGSFFQHGSKLSTANKETSFINNWTLGDPKVEIGTSQVDFEQLKLRLKQLEEERIVMQEDTEKSKEHVMLLRSIFKQLNTIEVHMKRSTSKKNYAQDDSKIVSVMEAVLSFSI